VVPFGAGDLGTTVRVPGTAVGSQIAGWLYLNNQNIRISFFVQQYPKKKTSGKLQVSDPSRGDRMDFYRHGSAVMVLK
jgi:hypothetical protein